ncbi:hypothetical protein O3P69_003963 [Scylla paramamosain]|uniref:Uncharacterized protein n=1 Tax=Scylla paramamosain TaxID=85552 RepID=A0AAW0UHP4_SCYPA
MERRKGADQGAFLSRRSTPAPPRLLQQCSRGRGGAVACVVKEAPTTEEKETGRLGSKTLLGTEEGKATWTLKVVELVEGYGVRWSASPRPPLSNLP